MFVVCNDSVLSVAKTVALFVTPLSNDPTSAMHVNELHNRKQNDRKCGCSVLLPIKKSNQLIAKT